MKNELILSCGDFTCSNFLSLTNRRDHFFFVESGLFAGVLLQGSAQKSNPLGQMAH